VSDSSTARNVTANDLALTALATHHDQAAFTPMPVPRFASLLRATLETGPWAVSAGLRHRTALAGGLDVSVERQIGERVRLIASVSNAGDAGSAAGPVGRQALLQVVAGF